MYKSILHCLFPARRCCGYWSNVKRLVKCSVVWWTTTSSSPLLLSLFSSSSCALDINLTAVTLQFVVYLVLVADLTKLYSSHVLFLFSSLSYLYDCLIIMLFKNIILSFLQLPNFIFVTFLSFLNTFVFQFHLFENLFLFEPVASKNTHF